MSKFLPFNVHRVERGGRVVVGLGLLSLLFVVQMSGWLMGVLGVVGLILVATGAVGTCPIFTALGVSTRRAEDGQG